MYAVIQSILAIAIGIFVYFKWQYSYWKRKKAPYLEPKFPFGNVQNPFHTTVTLGHQMQKNYNELQSQGHKHGGLYVFNNPAYLAVDPNFVKRVMIKDFEYFIDRGIYYNEKDDPLSAHLFNIEGDKWKSLRLKLTATFTSAKMRMMFSTVVTCGYQMLSAIKSNDDMNEPVNVKTISRCFTTDIIGSCAFGLDCNSFTDKNSEFPKYGNLIFTTLSKFEFLKKLVVSFNPNIGRFLGIKRHRPDVTAFFMKVVKDTVDHREKTNFYRNDFLQILIDLKNSETITKENRASLTIEQLAAQAFVFFMAGFETSSTTMSFCLYELSTNLSIQQKVREEVNIIVQKYDGNLTYEGIAEMKYLNQIIDETLRKYPPATLLNRICGKNYKIPNTDITIEKGTKVFIPVYALHHDPKYFPEPDKFDPDRFSEKNKAVVHPCTYMPFGEGPRMCIAARFGIMQAKVGLAILLKHFKFSLNERTKYPLEMDPLNVVLASKEVIWLNFTEV